MVNDIGNKGVEQDNGSYKEPARDCVEHGVENVPRGKKGIGKATADAQCKNAADGGPFFAFFARKEYPKRNGDEKGDEKGKEDFANGFLLCE